jgi:hypothetical protein
MQSGLTVAGVRNLGFRTDDARTDANDGDLRVKRSCSGMALERHGRKSSEEAWAENKKKLEMASIASAMVPHVDAQLNLHAP